MPRVAKLTVLFWHWELEAKLTEIGGQILINSTKNILFKFFLCSDALAHRLDNEVGKVDSSVDITPVVRLLADGVLHLNI